MEPDQATASNTTPGGPDRPKKKRSRLGCNTCRTRKVKCDERPNGCANCEKLHLECTYTRPGPIPRVHTGRRTYRSCNGCRIARCKCSGDRPSCTRCRENNMRCSYEEDAAKKGPRTADRQTVVRLDTQVTTDQPSDEGASVRQASLPASISGRTGSELPWLTVPQLPDAKHIRVLVNYYFQNFHSLRCFAFIHKPSFLRKLDDELGSSLQDNALLHIMCTLGAQFYALEHSDTVRELPDAFILNAGSHWAKQAENLVLRNTNKITIEGLMATQLLYDYALRVGKFSQAFIFSALMARMTQALQINLEYSPDLLNQSPSTTLSATTRECRRRLMWSCYVTDVLSGNGVDQLTLIHEKDLKIQLPCNDWSFLHEQPRITRALTGPPLSFVPRELIPADIDGNMGMLAYFLQHVEMRRRVLWYIKHLDQAKLPWLPDSEFAQLDHELQSWYESLPPNMEFTSSSIYMRKEASKLGALCTFHCAYHQTMCDLYRIGTPELYKLRSPFQFPPEMSTFQRRLQFALFKEARAVAAILAEAERHSPRMLGDTWLPTIAYDSNRIMLFYLTQVTEPMGMSKRDLVLGTIPYLQSNLKALKTMRATNAVADGLARAAETMLEKLGVDSNSVLPIPQIILDDPYGRNRQSVPGTPPQSAPDYVLNPLSIFRMARNEIPEGHRPENIMAPPDSVDTPTRRSTTSADNYVPPMDQSQDLDGNAEAFRYNLDMFFAPDQSVDWQSADIMVGSGMDNDGLLPWIGTSQMGEFMFEPPISNQ